MALRGGQVRRTRLAVPGLIAALIIICLLSLLTACLPAQAHYQNRSLPTSLRSSYAMYHAYAYEGASYAILRPVKHIYYTSPASHQTRLHIQEMRKGLYSSSDCKMQVTDTLCGGLPTDIVTNRVNISISLHAIYSQEKLVELMSFFTPTVDIYNFTISIYKNRTCILRIRLDAVRTVLFNVSYDDISSYSLIRVFAYGLSKNGLSVGEDCIY